MAPEIADAVTLKTVVVDDEQLAREELCYLLGQIGGVEIVAQAADGLEAIDAIESLDPDLVLLDVQMPGLTGFEVARRLLESGSESHVVFVTAFDRHAVEAFEVNAVDYLLKPVEAERLGTAVDRVRRRLQGRSRAASVRPPAELERLLQLPHRTPRAPGTAGVEGGRPLSARAHGRRRPCVGRG